MNAESIWVRAHRAIFPAGVLLAWLGLCGPARAEVYSFVDDQGVVHFTNRPHEPRYGGMTRLAAAEPAVAGRRPPDTWIYDGIIGLAARRHDVSPALVKAVIAAESAFEPGAVSHKGAQGLMQLMPATSSYLGVEDPLRPEQNVQGGTRYLREMIDRYGDLSLALAAYNAGPTAVDRHGGIPPYRETRDYVARVLSYYRTYYGDFGR